MLASITPLILTYNEEANIERTLEPLKWARRILIIDSFSSDGTPEIIARFPNVEVIQRRFESFADQCNFGLSKIDSEWVLSLDADYLLTEDLVEAISKLPREEGINGYSAEFQYCVYGKPLRKTVLPPRTILYRRAFAQYQNEGHSHRVHVSGIVKRLNGFIRHDDRKPLRRWLQSQIAYMELESTHLLTTSHNELSLPDRLRKHLFLVPVLMFFYTLLVHRLILDGWHGWFYVCQRTFAELLLTVHLLDARLKST